MSAANETGHAINVSNLHLFTLSCGHLGAAYQPALNRISMAGLTDLHSNALQAMQEVSVARAQWSAAVNERALAFKNLRPLATRLRNALKASGAPAESIKHAGELIRKMTGKRAGGTKATDNTTLSSAQQISVSQQSYDLLLQHFSGLVQLLKHESTYNPNEADLSLVSLDQYLQTLKAANNKVMRVSVALSRNRMLRNEILYGKDGLLETVRQVKNYVKSVFGSSAPEYKSLSRIPFKLRSRG